MDDSKQGYGLNLEEEAMNSGHPVTPEDAAITPTYGQLEEEKKRNRKDSFEDSDNDAVATGFVEEMENN